MFSHWLTKIYGVMKGFDYLLGNLKGIQDLQNKSKCCTYKRHKCMISFKFQASINIYIYILNLWHVSNFSFDFRLRSINE